MAYVIAEPCIGTKDTACVDVCPVDCIHHEEGVDRKLYIDPNECIDCGACEPECPVDAIKPDTEPGLEKWLALNREYSEKWPNITAQKPPPEDADKYKDEEDKFNKYFTPEPGSGD